MVERGKLERNLSVTRIFFITLAFLLCAWFSYSYAEVYTARTNATSTFSYNTNWVNLTPSPTPQPTTTPSPTPQPTRPPAVGATTSSPQPTGPWGVAQKIGENTYTRKIEYDSAMGSPQDMHSALNVYRNAHGKGSLIWDQTLADYATSRAETFKNMNGTDAHAGFNSFLDNKPFFPKPDNIKDRQRQ